MNLFHQIWTASKASFDLREDTFLRIHATGSGETAYSRNGTPTPTTDFSTSSLADLSTNCNFSARSSTAYARENPKDVFHILYRMPLETTLKILSRISSTASLCNSHRSYLISTNIEIMMRTHPKSWPKFCATTTSLAPLSSSSSITPPISQN